MFSRLNQESVAKDMSQRAFCLGVAARLEKDLPQLLEGLEVLPGQGRTAVATYRFDSAALACVCSYNALL